MDEVISETKQPRRRKWAKRRVPACIRLDVERERQVRRLSVKLKISKNQVHNEAIASLFRTVFADE